MVLSKYRVTTPPPLIVTLVHQKIGPPDLVI